MTNIAFQRASPVGLFGELTKRMFLTMEELGSTINAVDLFERLGLDVIGNAGFGFNFNALGDKHNKWVQLYESIRYGVANPIYILLPSLDTKFVHWFPKRMALHNNMTEFFNMIDQMINARRAALREEKSHDKENAEVDLLTAMLESDIGGQDDLSNESLRSDLCIFFLAGHETTANVLASVLYETACKQEIQDKMRKEALDMLGSDPVDVIPTLEQTRKMQYINMVIKETSRMHPPLLSVSIRTAQDDCYVGETFVPKGSYVSVDMNGLMRNPKIWKNPNEFDPERFAPGGEADQQASSLSWIPFSSGARQCAGMSFSMAQQRTVLSMMCKYWLMDYQ
ncbi:cytochrome P450-dit2 [Apophysomyces sp. BC1015]|nr:cytochrome P450-dit2 [Apophysomyces sp. BC1015]